MGHGLHPQCAAPSCSPAVHDQALCPLLVQRTDHGESPGISIGLNLAKAKISDKKHQTRGRRLLLPSQRPDVVVAEGPQAGLGIDLWS